MTLVGVGSLAVLLGSVLALRQVKQTGRILSVTTAKAHGSLTFEGNHRVGVNQQFTLKMMVDTDNRNINAAGLYLRFDPEKLRVTEMNTLKSFCQFYPEKKFDNRMGLVSLACGAPHPGLKGKNELVELTFTPLSVGTTTIRTAADSTLLTSDGKGTDILDEFPVWEVTISADL